MISNNVSVFIFCFVAAVAITTTASKHPLGDELRAADDVREDSYNSLLTRERRSLVGNLKLFETLPSVIYNTFYARKQHRTEEPASLAASLSSVENLLRTATSLIKMKAAFNSLNSSVSSSPISSATLPEKFRDRVSTSSASTNTAVSVPSSTPSSNAVIIYFY
jgi:hypothetical protein